MLSPELVAELEKLQDDVPSFDAEEAVAIVERELGAPIASRYEEFDTKPIAAASLGQVTRPCPCNTLLNRACIIVLLSVLHVKNGLC